MLLRLVSGTVVAALALGCFAVESNAGERRGFRRGPVNDHYYAGPRVVRAMPGLRLFFGDYALSEEEYDALYGAEESRFDESYYEPEAAVPPRAPVKKKAASVTSKSAATASIEEPPATESKPVVKKAAAGLSCDKAASIITGYGFSAVKPKTCAGKVYAFNASRDGKPFAIKLDAASGELTEVKKLQ